MPTHPPPDQRSTHSLIPPAPPHTLHFKLTTDGALSARLLHCIVKLMVGKAREGEEGRARGRGPQVPPPLQRKTLRCNQSPVDEMIRGDDNERQPPRASALAEDDITETFLKPEGPEQESGLHFHPPRPSLSLSLCMDSWKCECKACGSGGGGGAFPSLPPVDLASVAHLARTCGRGARPTSTAPRGRRSELGNKLPAARELGAIEAQLASVSRGGRGRQIIRRGHRRNRRHRTSGQ